MLRSSFLSFALILLLSSQAFSQSDVLQSGPMVGYSTMREVLLWVQTKSSADVHFEYWEAGTDRKNARKTDKVRTQKDLAFVAKIVVTPLEPGKKFEYALFINDKEVKRPYPLKFQTQTLWQFRTDPPAFSFVFGSCSYINEEKYDRPGNGYGGEYEIFKSIAEKAPDFMLWGGDNVYLRDADWNSRTGIFHRYTHTRSNSEMQAILGSAHHYATWDDHDYGPNDSDRSFFQKHLTTEAFNLFWGNLATDVTGAGGITSYFEWQDCAFFLLDDRYHRAPNYRKTGKREMLGEAQIQWLIDALKSSRAPFKFVVTGGQVVNDFAYFENYAIFAEERTKLLKAIEDEGIEGVIFLTGDRHHTVLSMMDRPTSYPLYDFTCSSLTAGSHSPKDGENSHKVEGTVVGERNFSVLSVSGERKDRELNIKVFNVEGEMLWERVIKANDLRSQRR
ncbi:MAG: alkaline phosphatase D family protein [Bacteroidota bacterium]